MEGLRATERRLVLDSVKEGSLGKACKLLLGAGLPPVRDAEQKLLDLHPPGVLPPRDEESLGNFDFDVQEVRAALRSFDPTSGPGPSGLRAGHLQQLACSRHGNPLLEALSAFCSLLAIGGFGPEVMHLLTSVRGVPLPKKGGGVWPIAVGDVLRRTAAKCVMERVLPVASEYLLPIQVGVQVPDAAELVARPTVAARGT